MNDASGSTETGAAAPPTEPDHDDPRLAVTQLLDEAVAKAQEAGMATSDVLGIFYYYAHCIAASYRDNSVRESPGASLDGETS